MDAYEKFISDLKRVFDLDLTGYKRPQMERRINSLMRVLKIEGYDAFINEMKGEQAIFNRFLDHLTINVSEFFRNQAQWDVLREKIIPDLLTKSNELRIWSAGCSTGQEPYSLAMLMEEHFPRVNYSILASDFDIRVLDKAKTGKYTEREVAGMESKYLTKYFSKNNEEYNVLESLKRKITFKKHNLITERFESGFDLILCRNVVIYFTEETKAELYKNFFNSLKPGGILFTGSTEQIITAREIGYSSAAIFFYQKPM
ncbi:MAG: protein-glutamate O-methyltransferase CheR [Eubacteriales bacterium]|nr:protein-glutamate O-methyltransferase CheR [Eubacteriales bacterium]